MANELTACQEHLHRLTRSDPDPRVRHRAQVLLLVAQGQSVSAVARLFATAGHCVRTWRERFLAEGRAGLLDRPRRGRPPKLDEDDLVWLCQALDHTPQDYGLLVTTWSIRELQALVQHERGVEVSVYTLHRVVQALGYRYRRPRHDLRHRQDAEAVAAAQQVLDWLEKKALLTPNDSIWSFWMNARSTPTPTWRRSGARRGSR